MSRNRRASARRSAEDGLSVLMMTDRKGERMDRLTKRSERTGSAVPGELLGDICLRVSGCEEFDFCEGCPIRLLLNKLCEYEDTGLTPAQIKGYCTTNMMKKEIQDYEMAVLTQCGIHLDNSITAAEIVKKLDSVRRMVSRGTAPKMTIKLHKLMATFSLKPPMQKCFYGRYNVAYHEEGLYSVKDSITGALSFVYAKNPYEAIENIRVK